MTFEIALPDSTLSDCSDLRQKTIKTGQIARALAVFKVERVILYEPSAGEKNPRDLNLLDKLLRYMDTPQYLRREIFPMSPSLKYAGLLPPLRTRSHPLETRSSAVRDGEYRWGIQKRPGQVDIGLDEPIEYEKQIGTRVPTLFHLSKHQGRVTLKPTTRESVGYYFGYDVETISSLTDYLEANPSKTRIALSRLGLPFQKVESDIESTLSNTHNLLAIFGGPQSGVRDLVKDKESLKRNIDFWVNTIPDQGTETVRLEEALLISLGQFNSSFGNLVMKDGYYK
ncbi:MAG: putative RNA uridine N3 methyltransferase [Candidatus Thorarchaeota archaeon]